ncbi:hypothetical protein [Paracraurococcus lichenis]|uniref:Lipoprotein n=1 Tax=Paracraurococcus lichenis TaxID=3064888 RepID=A0ABT9DVJ3_9PROT|nr:hypothetical protein [Paracraurococcus sp. LOR1-02]MDO9707921.1 hypothetical protein [Paracraurococcus sp. LOR1-02]
MRPAVLLLALAAAACSIAPAPPDPDPVAGPPLRQGELAAADPVLAAACVSRGVPGTVVELRREGAAVRPVAEATPVALVLDRQPGGAVAWRLLGPGAGTVAEALDRALQDCAGGIGGPA